MILETLIQKLKFYKGTLKLNLLQYRQIKKIDSAIFLTKT